MPRARQRRPAPPTALADPTLLETAGALQRARDAWGDFLHAYQWDHFVTLTYERVVPPARARCDFTDGFVRRAAFEARRPLAWFYALEWDAAGERVHVHALIAGTARLDAGRRGRAWKAGNTCVREYDATRGAAWYVVKSLVDGRDDSDNYDISRRRPPRRLHRSAA